LAERRHRTLYGRRRGKPLRAGRQRLTETLLPRLALSAHDRQAQTLDPRTLFPQPPEAVWLEIGFGAGEHLARLAAENSSVGFIGCEPYINGVASLLRHIDERGLDNIRILVDDAALLLPALVPGSIARAYLLFPDPWPKRRHNRRRFVNPGNIDLMSSALADGAAWHLASDSMAYVRWMLRLMTTRDDFRWLARRPGDWRQPSERRPPTRYEEKARTRDDVCVYLEFQRLSRKNP
jgi:tRNA (guanine-N7-)-methyltransferase